MGKKLGKGNFGDVYLVRHIILGFIFAMKIIPKKVVKEKKMEKQIIW
jgi:serine/threonine protein kinase